MGSTSPWSITLIVTLLAALAIWAPWETPQRPQLPVTRFAIHLPPEQTLAHRATAVELSPDGKQLVYVAEAEGHWQLYRRSINELQSEEIAGPLAHPGFSPDGEWVAFVSPSDEILKKVSVQGGLPQTICPKPPETAAYMGTSWGPDDMIYFGTDVGIMRVSESGGTPEAVTRVREAEDHHPWPYVLPGGKAVIFSITHPAVRAVQGIRPLSIEVVSLETGKRKTLVEEGTHPRYLPTGHLIYAWKGRLLAAPFDLEELSLTGAPTVILEGIGMREGGKAVFSVSESGSLAYVSEHSSTATGTEASLVWVDREGGEEPLAMKPGLYRWPRISHDGSRIAVSAIDSGNTDVWIYDLAGQTSTRLTFDPAIDDYPLWTPDDLRVVFSSNRDGAALNLFSKAADGTGPVERLTNSPKSQRPASFSPNGKMVAFMEDLDIGVLWMGNEPTSKLLLRGGVVNSAISPEGQWVAYDQFQTAGRAAVYVRPFPSVEEGSWQISSLGSSTPLWNPSRHFSPMGPEKAALFGIKRFE